jgi:hypothetical protein
VATEVAILSACWCNYYFLKTSETSPHCKAFCEGIKSDVKIYLIAFTFPAILVSLWVPPIPGIKPNFSYGNPNLAYSEHTIISHKSAN